MKKRAIFSYSNTIVNPEIIKHQKLVLDKFKNNVDFDFIHVHVNQANQFKRHSDMLDMYVNKIFNENNYDTLLILDIDCIPLNENAIKKTFEKAENGILIGNIQRSNHINNNKHVFVAPSAFCVTKKLYQQLGNPSFTTTYRGDVAEEITFIAESKNIPFEFYVPSKFETSPVESPYWALTEKYNNYGIGTTFVDSENNEMFYHLFQSIHNRFTKFFVNKCNEILNK